MLLARRFSNPVSLSDENIADAIIFATSVISSSLNPLVVTAGVPNLIPDVTNGLCGSFGTVFLFAVIPTRSKTFAMSLPVLPVLLKSSVIK